MSTITASQFNEAAKILKLDYKWNDDGDGIREDGELEVNGKSGNDVDWYNGRIQRNLEKIDQLAKDLLVFERSQVDPERNVYHRFGDTPDLSFVLGLVDPERIAANLLEYLPLKSKSCQETEFAQKAFEELAAMGVDVQFDDFLDQVAAMDPKQAGRFSCGGVAPESANLVGVLPATDPDLPTWNLSFHLDTKQKSFEGFSRSGDVIAPGPDTPLGADDKAGLAILLEVLRVLKERKIPHGDIRIVALVGEEATAGGAQLIAGEAFRGDVIATIDGTDSKEIGRAAPFIYIGGITITTKTSHPAMIDAEGAVNACVLGAEFLTRAGFSSDGHPFGDQGVLLHSTQTACGQAPENDDEAKKFGPFGHTSEPLPAFNSIPSKFAATWQLRDLRGEEVSAEFAVQLEKTLQEVCAEASEGRAPVSCKMTGFEKPFMPGYLVDSEHASLQLLEQGLAAIGGGEVTEKQFGGFNGNFIHSRFGEEMIVVGIGAKQIHTPEETVSVSGMGEVAQLLLAAMIESYQYQRVEN